MPPKQPDLFGPGPPPPDFPPDRPAPPKAEPTVSLRLIVRGRRPKALLLETDTLPSKSAWVPSPPVEPDPDHDGFFILPRKMALEKGLM